MALTNIDLCSRALLLLGAETIQSFDEDSVEANTMGNLYEHVYHAALTEKNWGFATKDVALNRLADAPTDLGWLHQFQLPSDCLAIINVLNSSWGRSEYIKQGNLLLSNEPTLNLKYVYTVDESQLPAWFVDYLVHKLAVTALIKVTGVNEDRDRLSADLKRAKSNALKRDEEQNPQRDVMAQARANLIAIRNGGSSSF